MQDNSINIHGTPLDLGPVTKKIDEIYTTTFEDVEKTARAFGHVAIHVPAYKQVIVFDDTIMGKGFIKQFDDSPLGLVYARRWAVRLLDSDEDIEFDALMAEVEGDLKR